MRYFQPDTVTRGNVAIPNMASGAAAMRSWDVTNRALMAAIPQADGTDALLRGGLVSGVEWMECPDDMWAAVSPHLQGLEITSTTTTKPAGYVRNTDRPHMARVTGKQNLVIISDSLARHGGTGSDGVDSYGTKGFQLWAGTTVTPWGGSAADEYTTTDKALLHYGVGGSFFAGGDVDNFAKDHSRMSPIKYETLGLKSGDIIYVALGTNDFANTTISGLGPTGAQVWARAQSFVGGLRAAFPSVKIIMGTVPRRSENTNTNQRNIDYNTLLWAGYAVLGVDAICDIENAHSDFNNTTGNSAGDAYLPNDNTHFSNLGITAAASTFATTLAGV